MQNETKQNINPYKVYSGEFCKVIVRNGNDTRSLKGILSTPTDKLIRIKGSYVDTMINVSEIIAITKKQTNEANKNGYNEREI